MKELKLSAYVFINLESHHNYGCVFIEFYGYQKDIDRAFSVMLKDENYRGFIGLSYKKNQLFYGYNDAELIEVSNKFSD
jgi:hypothetical protein